jgi:multiple sugar transport system permease protein
MILIYFSGVLPYSIIMLRAFFDGMPDAIEEAALIDGCSRFQIVFRIAIPLMIPGIASVLIFDFVNTWNELFHAVLFIDSDALRTIPVALNAMIQKFDIAWGPMMAGTVIGVLPTIALFAFLRKYMVAGLTSGAVKG